MAKTKPQDRNRGSRNKKAATSNGTTKKKMNPEQLLGEAISLLHTSKPDEALISARRALALLQPADEEPRIEALPAFNLLGEICVELGDTEIARDYFTVAAEIDPEGILPEEAGGGADKFLWLAQLSEEGGADSVQNFEQGATILRQQINALEGTSRRSELQDAMLEDKKRKMATALCGITEVYMTDLSWEADAEGRCETMVTEAMLIAPNSSEVLQTLANVRLSQSKLSDAQSALRRSLELWKDLPPEDVKVPDFPTRISLARLLMEAELREEAFEVLERLVKEDDSSVEAWYLGGWCLYLLAQARKEQASSAEDSEGALSDLKSSRGWLLQAMKMYQALQYEDERLRDHAVELIEEMNKVLGPPPEDGAEGDDDEEEWEGISDSEDEEMEGA